jgi:hypothetical protein
LQYIQHTSSPSSATNIRTTQFLSLGTATILALLCIWAISGCTSPDASTDTPTQPNIIWLMAEDITGLHQRMLDGEEIGYKTAANLYKESKTKND